MNWSGLDRGGNAMRVKEVSKKLIGFEIGEYAKDKGLRRKM